MGKSNRESKAASMITGRKKAQVIHKFIFSKHRLNQKRKNKLPHINGLY
jgi:hypothetical protein